MNSASVSSPADAVARAGRITLAVLGVWLVAALAVSASGVLQNAPRFAPGVLIGSGFAAFLLAWTRAPSFRAWVMTLDPRPLILFHTIRVVAGIGLLRLAAQGQLSHEFADIAGPGDIAVGILAIPAAMIALRAPRAAWLWNVLGLADILLVIAVAQKILLFGDPETMLGLARVFPFGLIPLFVVPMILATHVALFAKLRRT